MNQVVARRILIINLGGMGDILLSAPAVTSLMRRYPDAEFFLLTSDGGREAAETFFGKMKIESLSMRGMIPRARNARVVSMLRRRRFDLAVNMRSLVSAAGALKMKILLSAIAPGRTAGRDTDGRGAFFDIRIPESLGADRHEMDYDIAAAESLGAVVKDRGVDIRIDPASAKKISLFLAGHDVSDGDTLIVVHPGGKPSHRWPLRRFGAVVGLLDAAMVPDGAGDKRGKHRHFFMMTGAKDETGLARGLSKMSAAKVINGAGLFGLQELAALLRRCSLFICNDTGPMHLAALLQTPMVAIFGPGYVKRFDPRVISGAARVLYKAFPCSPCDRARCGHMRCLDAITPDDVAGEALRFLPSRRGA